MFKKLTESIVHQLDPKGNLVPVPSFSDHEYFRPLCLVKRKRKSIFHLFPRYELTHYRLDNMLLPREGIGKAHIYHSLQFPQTKHLNHLCLNSTMFHISCVHNSYHTEPV